MRCKNCGWERELTPCEAKKIQEQEYFECGECGSSFTKLETEIDCPMRYDWFSLERESQCILMNALFQRGARVWDCPAEIGLCDDPIIIDNIAFGIQVGDFPFLWQNQYYITEMKWQNYVCSEIRNQGIWKTSRGGRHLTEPQSKLLLGGYGVLVYIAEPFLKEVGLSTITGITQEECFEKMADAFWSKLALDEFSYNIWIIDSERFKILWKEHFSKKPPTPSQQRATRIVNQWSFSPKLLDKYIPEAKIQVTLSEYKQGVIADRLLQLL